ncbi:MAG: CrcB family protein [Acidimicrobiales bacterium]
MSIDLVVTFVLFSLAAAAGAGIRFVVGGSLDNDDLPMGTLAVNILASFALGIITGAGDPLPTVLGIGAIGALSTWSATANEAAEMSREGKGVLAGAYLALSVSSCVLAAWFGLRLGPVVL